MAYLGQPSKLFGLGSPNRESCWMALNAISRSKYRDSVPSAQMSSGPRIPGLESSMLFYFKEQISLFLVKMTLHIDKEQSSKGPSYCWREKFKLLSLSLKLLAPFWVKRIY